jgi:uncharacterized protein YkwD
LEVNGLFHNRLRGTLVLLAGLVACATARADALSAVQVLREGGCGGIVPGARPVQRNALLDRVAEQWAAGRSLSAAAGRSGYPTASAAGVHVTGPDSALLEVLRRSGCRAVTNPDAREIGIYRRGMQTWLVLASPHDIPSAPPLTAGSVQQSRSAAAPAAATTVSAQRALQLVNDVRARGTRCGSRAFAPAPPVTLSGTLAGVAYGHATDMAQHNYFEHEDLAGHSPADRVRAVGYREKLVGENIAYGPETTEEVVQGWLDSPGHCENIMDPRFAQMGIAAAAGQASRHGLYWVQVLAAPQT